MKILMVSSYLPYPLFSGGHIRLYNLMKHLSNNHEITLVCEKREYQSELDIERVRAVSKNVIVVDRKKQWTVKNIIKSLFSTAPFLLVGHDNEDLKEALKKELEKEKYDLIHVETFYVMQNLPKTNIPVVLVEHNVEYDVYRRFAKSALFLLKPFLYFDVLKIKISEESYWKKAKKLVAVSLPDAKKMRADEIVPNGVDIEKYAFFKKRKQNNKALFIGDFKWVQNRDAVEWLLKKAWPVFLSSFKGKSLLWIVGKSIPAYLKSKKVESVYFDENAPSETESIYQDANVLLAPIRVGGGTSFKILEAMSTGLPVITTYLGNAGIMAKPNEEILIAESSKDFSAKLAELFTNRKKYEEVSKNASEFIKVNYDWRKIVLKLENVYEESI